MTDRRSTFPGATTPGISTATSSTTPACAYSPATRSACSPLANSTPGSDDGATIPCESIEAWERSNGGRPSSGRYTFELRLYSTLADAPKPLLRLADLRFELS